MKIELRNLKHYHALSEETNAFSANLYIDGVKTASCQDDGKGGDIRIEAYKGKNELLKTAYEYAKTLPNEPVYDLEMDLELLIGLQVEEDLKEKEFKKQVKKLEKKNVVFGKNKEEILSQSFSGKDKKKVDISDMLQNTAWRSMLEELLKKLIMEGNTIYNTNIPKELIDKLSVRQGG